MKLETLRDWGLRHVLRLRLRLKRVLRPSADRGTPQVNVALPAARKASRRPEAHQRHQPTEPFAARAIKGVALATRAGIGRRQHVRLLLLRRRPAFAAFGPGSVWRGIRPIVSRSNPGANGARDQAGGRTARLMNRATKKLYCKESEVRSPSDKSIMERPDSFLPDHSSPRSRLNINLLVINQKVNSRPARWFTPPCPTPRAHPRQRCASAAPKHSSLPANCEHRTASRRSCTAPASGR
jgi:hypothetical protein